MRRTVLLFAAALLAGCAAAPEPEPAPVVEEAPAPPPAPAPEPRLGPVRQVALLVGGEPSVSIPAATLVALGEDAMAYVATCRERERKAADDPEAWSTAQAAPVCLAVRFAPPVPLGNAAGVEVTAAELLMPLGAPRWDGVVLARESSKPWAALISGDPAILDRLRSKVAGALSTTKVAGP
jgi:hypothetical protein